MDRVIATVDEQIALEKEREEEGINKTVRELDKAVANGRFSETVFGRVLLKLGFDKYVNKLNEYQHTKLSTHSKKDRDLLLLLSNNMEEVAYITLLSCINAAATNKSLSYTATEIVVKLKDVFLLEKLKKDNPKLHTYLGYEYRRASKRQKEVLVKKHISKLYDLGKESNDKAMIIRLGTTLINLLELSGANIIRVSRTHKKKLGVASYVYTITLTDEANEVIKGLDLADIAAMNISKLPMVVPPVNWSSPFNGGWYRGKRFLFTVKSSDVSKHLKKGKYDKIYPVINKLQHTAWRINTKVLDVVSTIFNDNMIDPKSPTLAPTLYGGLPTRDAYKADDFIHPNDYDNWHEYNRTREDINIRSDNLAPKRLSVFFSLSIAERMKKYASLYFPYVLDYRGRVYANVSFINPQGEDYVKAMLELGEGRYLDEVGERWLAIHTANVYGLDKVSYDERISWYNTNLPMILAISNDPLGTLSDWVWSDSPFEFLAACMATNDHLNGRKVHLAIQLDATCSGIQMYSGLLRDRQGAEAVNVIGNARKDIYQMVADRVNEHLANKNYSKFIEYRDREGKTHIVNSEPVANSMIGKIDRGIVKRNVMTVPYSVTLQGMSNQIWDKIDEASLKGKEFWEGDKWVVNRVLTQLNHASIYEIIDGARQGQEFLVNISKKLDAPATWLSPIYDFPIRQTALSMKEVRVSTPYGSLAVNMEVPKLNRTRQSNSIAPNFIHNIDSTILLYCIEHMDTQIGVIHDCFLVHPNDGDDIQLQYKLGFIAVMESDPLRNIQKQLDPDGDVEFPTYGDLCLHEVLDSEYIIS